MNNNKKINAAIIYARTDSSRLPQKIFSDIAGYSILECLLRRSSLLAVDKVILATTSRKIDDDLEKSLYKYSNLHKKKYECLRGDPFDLIKRTIEAIDHYKIQNFCRINGDSPFYPFTEINKGFKLLSSEIKFINNIRHRTFPYGIAVEVINSDYYKKSLLSSPNIQKEHMTSHIYSISQKNQEQVLTNPYGDYSSKSFAIDSLEDLNEINNKLSKNNSKPWKVNYMELCKDE